MASLDEVLLQPRRLTLSLLEQEEISVSHLLHRVRQTVDVIQVGTLCNTLGVGAWVSLCGARAAKGSRSFVADDSRNYASTEPDRYTKVTHQPRR